MKNLFNNISQEDKNRILEMHSGKKNTISEQMVKPKIAPYGSKPSRLPVEHFNYCGFNSHVSCTISTFVYAHANFSFNGFSACFYKS